MARRISASQRAIQESSSDVRSIRESARRSSHQRQVRATTPPRRSRRIANSNITESTLDPTFSRDDALLWARKFGMNSMGRSWRQEVSDMFHHLQRHCPRVLNELHPLPSKRFT